MGGGEIREEEASTGPGVKQNRWRTGVEGQGGGGKTKKRTEKAK